ncbi:hypothetical protein [Lacimicrobium alkaliphilum]|uniref:Uncharacterized protein n=1 Tax=Lacimicrobium alkaliphilum TaxID=1526571 RepID=A0ABQ1RA32_9ALTE|nr:hypothetical protein [Lacimicrobium alkaliphilum]GGD61600.1 hypothetical protein GCM10011357_16170 [Lacimicrobium alkaliphilum]
MPRTVVTEKTMPLILHELDKWSGKLTWNLFSDRVAKILNEESLSYHALIKYEVIKEAFTLRKKALKEVKENTGPTDATVEMLLKENEVLRAKNAQLERQVTNLQQQFIHWQANLHKMPHVDIVALDSKLNAPLPEVKRR